MLLTLVALVLLFGLGPLAIAGIGVTAALLLYEHSIISPGDLRRLNAAFFTLNGIISVLFLLLPSGSGCAAAPSDTPSPAKTQKLQYKRLSRCARR